ncbi:Golgin subfamily A member 2 [Tupaia chinensis]|uniref:Golgin subfamily A member 2 n=1 Tax=Tupaia chinensis TaxID=246437 RepID=L9LBL2_TUPCH|nr:Golgin subfamily A member 2 [Tupaia chinensis]
MLQLSCMLLRSLQAAGKTLRFFYNKRGGDAANELPLKAAKKHLEAVTQQNQQLWAQLSLIGPLGERGGLDKEALRFKLGLLEELGSPEAVLKEHKLSCQQLTHLATSSQEEPQREPLFMCGDGHQALQGTMEKLQVRDYIVLYQRQRAMLKERYREKEEYIHQQVQNKEKLKEFSTADQLGGE